MKRTNLLAAAVFMAMTGAVSAQAGIGTTSPDASSMLDVASTNAGMLMPRMTTVQRDAIVLPAKGLAIFNTTTNSTETNTGTPTVPAWTSSGNIYTMDGALTGNRTVTQGANTLAFTSTAVNGFSVDGNTFSVDAANHRVGIGTSAPHGAMQFANIIANRKIMFWQTADNDNEFFGFGMQFGSLRYQVAHAAMDSHVFFVGTSPTTNTELLRIEGNGNVGIGTLIPKTKLQVVGLPTYANDAAAAAGGLTPGAFYKTAGGVLMVKL